MKPIPMVIAGPSGCGKSTLLKKLLVEFPDSFGFSISREYSQLTSITNRIALRW